MSAWAGQPPPPDLSAGTDFGGGGGGGWRSPSPMSPLSPSACAASHFGGGDGGGGGGGGGGGVVQLIGRVPLAGMDWILSADGGPRLSLVAGPSRSDPRARAAAAEPRVVVVCVLLPDEDGGAGGGAELRAMLGDLERRGRAGYALLGQVMARPWSVGVRMILMNVEPEA